MTQQVITKTDFIQFLNCPEELWLQKNRKDLIEPPSMDSLYRMEQGILIDRLARKLFEAGRTINGINKEARNVRFQPKIEVEGYLAIADITIEEEGNGVVDILEVKASTSVKPEHIYDVAFQKMVFEKGGVKVNKCILIHVDKTYTLNGDLIVEEMLKAEDITDNVNAVAKETFEKAALALMYIQGKEPPKRITLGCTNKLKCPFVKYHYPKFPEYSVYDISRIHKSKLKSLVDNEVFDIMDVPLDFKLSAKQRLQVDLIQQEEIIVKKEQIKAVLRELSYPLYFLDYETFSYAVPSQSKHSPYQQMVFQYSLHVLESEDADLQHFEYLLKSKEEPVENLVQQLKKDIGSDKGTVIVWNDSFEKSRNKELINIFPNNANFLQSVNDRIFDLMIIFRDGLYLHPKFKGSYSIKKVLPVLCPDLSYKSLAIQNGTEAFVKWHHMTDGRLSQEERDKVYNGLLSYCHLDTLAMVRIWEELIKI